MQCLLAPFFSDSPTLDLLTGGDNITAADTGCRCSPNGFISFGSLLGTSVIEKTVD
jgi:hypothetical protein